MRGIYGGRKVLRASINRLRKNFNALVKENPRIKCVYLTVQEVSRVKKKGSINYLEVTKKGLHPFGVFALRESRSNTTSKGQWKRFVEYLTNE